MKYFKFTLYIKILILLFLGMSLFFLFSRPVFSQKQKIDFGKQEFLARCSNCHGDDGKGVGWLSYFLTLKPTNLTILAKKNGGILPAKYLYESISGDNVPIHGPSDMPAWGIKYRQEAPEYFYTTPYDAEIYAQSRIYLLMDYINRIQIK